MIWFGYLFLCKRLKCVIECAYSYEWMLSGDSKDSDWSPPWCGERKLKTQKTNEEGSHIYAQNNALFELEKKMLSKSMLTMMDTVQADKHKIK